MSFFRPLSFAYYLLEAGGRPFGSRLARLPYLRMSLSVDHSTFLRNRARLLVHEVAGEFYRGVVEQARVLRPLSHEHFTVDGTLVEAWASLIETRSACESYH